MNSIISDKKYNYFIVYFEIIKTEKHDFLLFDWHIEGMDLVFMLDLKSNEVITFSSRNIEGSRVERMAETFT